MKVLEHGNNEFKIKWYLVVAYTKEEDKVCCLQIPCLFTNKWRCILLRVFKIHFSSIKGCQTNPFSRKIGIEWLCYFYFSSNSSDLQRFLWKTEGLWRKTARKTSYFSLTLNLEYFIIYFRLSNNRIEFHIPTNHIQCRICVHDNCNTNHWNLSSGAG